MVGLRQFKTSLLALFPLLFPAKRFQCFPCVSSRCKLKQLAEETEKKPSDKEWSGLCLLVAVREPIWLKMLILWQTSSFNQFVLLHKPSWYHKEVGGEPRSHSKASTLKTRLKKRWDEPLRHGQALLCLCLCRQSTILASQQTSQLDLTVAENYF